MNFFLLFIFLIVFSVEMGTAYSQSEPIPAWVKGVAEFWAEDKITDTEFVEALEFLIESGIIKVVDPRVSELEKEISELREKINLLEYENKELEEPFNYRIPDFSNKEITYSVYDNAVSDSVLEYVLNQWSDLNPQLVFVQSDSDPILKIVPMATKYELLGEGVYGVTWGAL